MYPGWLIEGFQRTITECDLIDVELSGYHFTWERGRGTRSWVEVRLDRALVSSNWTNYFPDTKLTNLEHTSSDHCPIMLEPFIRADVGHSKRFIFENAWLKDPLCFEIVKDCWRIEERGDIISKINLCAAKLSKWGRKITGNFASRIRRCKKEMKSLKYNRDTESVRRYGEAKKKLFEILEQKETF